jgi:hypothetical protein
MEEYPEEFRTPPLPLVALVGLPEFHLQVRFSYGRVLVDLLMHWRSCQCKAQRAASESGPYIRVS